MARVLTRRSEELGPGRVLLPIRAEDLRGLGAAQRSWDRNPAACLREHAAEERWPSLGREALGAVQGVVEGVVSRFFADDV
jgi:hypothetical protein